MDTAEFLRPLFYRNVATLISSVISVANFSKFLRSGFFTARILSAFAFELIEAVQGRRRSLPPSTSR